MKTKTFILCLFMAAHAACGSEPQRGTPVPPPADPLTAEVTGEGPPPTLAGMPLRESPETWAAAQAFANSRDACTSTQGRWDPALLSCTCPTGQLFALDTGCGAFVPPRGGAGCERPLAQMDGQNQAQCARSLTLQTLLLNVDLSAFKPAEAKNLVHALDNPNTSLFAGLTLPAGGGAQHLTLSNRLPAILPSVAAKWHQVEVFPEATHTTSPWDPTSPPRNRTKACVTALTPLSANAKGLCHALAGARNGLAADAKTPWRIDVFGDAAGHEVLNAQATVAKLQVSYRVYLQNGLPLQRQVEISAPDEQLEVLLSARGSIDAVTWFGKQEENQATAGFTSKWLGVAGG